MRACYSPVPVCDLLIIKAFNNCFQILLPKLLKTRFLTWYGAGTEALHGLLSKESLLERILSSSGYNNITENECLLYILLFPSPGGVCRNFKGTEILKIK